MHISEFILSGKNIERNSVLWNMVSSMLYAFQSVILLMVLTRTVGLIEAGIFTLAYANANLFLTIGKYGMRNFQVSDVKKQYSFVEYLISRELSTAIMMAVALIYTVYATLTLDYSMEKSMTIIWMCCFKAADSMEDVYYGEYQRQGRLDVATKIMTLRLAVSILFFAVFVIVTKKLLLSLICTTVLTVILLTVLLKISQKSFSLDKEKSNKNIFGLLQTCFPLALGSFLSFYIGNAPKYAIDSILNDELQACYGFLSMPVFVIGLLNGFIFTPMLYGLSRQWNEHKISSFVRETFIQIVVVFGITLICLAGAYVLGIPVLSLLYNTDLTLYKKELLILLAGGGFLGLSGLLSAVLTIMRRQKEILFSYIIVAVLAVFFSNTVVRRYEMFGAALLYLILMGMLCVCFGIIYLYALGKKDRRGGDYI